MKGLRTCGSNNIVMEFLSLFLMAISFLIFSISLSISSTSRPRSHLRLTSAAHSLPFMTYHLGLSGMIHMSARNGMTIPR